MKTTVVNLRNSAYDVYIGRAGHGKSGYFGNPIIRGKKCQECGEIHWNDGDTLQCYRQYFESRLHFDKAFKDLILGLRGKILGCFCKPKPCHGDIIAEYLNQEVKS